MWFSQGHYASCGVAVGQHDALAMLAGALHDGRNTLLAFSELQRCLLGRLQPRQELLKAIDELGERDLDNLHPVRLGHR